MKIGAITDCFGKGNINAINTASKLGINGVQIYATSGEFSIDMSDEKKAEYKKALADNGLVVSALCGDMGGYGFEIEADITADGAIVADFITSGTLVANIIKAGTLSSQDGSSYWNLETGEVMLRAYATTESVEETNTRIDEINEQKMYRLVITSSNGNIFKNGNINTTLTATVFSWDDNITDTLDSNQFIWTRVSDDAEADKEWNSAHFGGAKSIEITSDDVNVRATFFCDLIDTTTRKSLLG